MSDGLGAWFRDTPESRQMLSEEELKLERDEALARAEEERDRRARVLRGWRRAIGDRHEALARAEAAEAVVKDYDHRINWQTTCQTCATTLDNSIREYDRAEEYKAVIEKVRAFAVDEYRRTAQEVLREVLDLLPEVTP